MPTTERRTDWSPKPPTLEGMDDEWGWGSFADIKTVKVDWLWYPYIPKGRLTSIEGDPGVGKSWLISAIAAAVSAGSPLPGERPEDRRAPGKVLMLSGEDGIADTIKPRLEACGARMDNIHFPMKNGVPAKFTLDAKGSAWLNANMTKLDAAVVFIDPVQLFMGSKVDMNRANEVREFMDSLHSAAERTNCAVILVRHFNKNGSATKLYKGLGSIDFAASLRSIIQVELGANGVRQAHHVKCNNAPEGDTITYTVSPFEWGPLIPRYVAQTAQRPSRTPRKYEQAQAFIREALAKGPVGAVEILREGEAAGFTAATLNFAKKGIAKSVKVGRDNWLWELTEGPADDAVMGRPAAGREVDGVGDEDHGSDHPGRGGVGREERRPGPHGGPLAPPLGVDNSPPDVSRTSVEPLRYDRGGDGGTGKSPPGGPPGGAHGAGGVAPLWEQELARIRGGVSRGSPTS